MKKSTKVAIALLVVGILMIGFALPNINMDSLVNRDWRFPPWFFSKSGTENGNSKYLSKVGDLRREETTQSVSVEGIEEIDLNISAGEVIIRTSREATEITLESSEIHRGDIREYRIVMDTDNGILKISEERTKNVLEDWFRQSSLIATLTIPIEMSLKEMTLKTNFGRVEIADLITEKIIAETNAGELLLKKVDARAIDLKTDLGAVTLEDCVIGGGRAATEAGAVEFKGMLKGTLDVSTDVGAVEITLQQPKENVGYDLSSDMGSIQIDREEYEGFNPKATFTPEEEAARIVGRTAMGSLELKFDQ